MQKPSPVLFLIDASSYLYRAFHALPPLTGPAGSPTNAAFGFTTMLMKLLREATPEYLAVIFDAPGGSFRSELYREYKAQRPPMPGDLVAQIPVVHEIIAGFALADLSIVGVEADDVIATIATRASFQGMETVVVSSDKDLMQIIGGGVRLWDTMRDRWFDAEAVRERFGVAPEQIVDLLGLMGDSSDNIPGVKGIGEKTATTLIQRFGSIEAVLANLEEVATLPQLRGAKKVANLLRDQADQARLSRQLAVVRRDVVVECDLESFRVRTPDPERLRPIFERLGFQRLLADTVARSTPPVSVDLQRVDSPEALAARMQVARLARRVAIVSEADGWSARGLVCALTENHPFYVPSSLVGPTVAALMSDAGVEKVAHDLKTDLHALSAVAPVIEPAFDLMVASYLLEASATHRLEDLAARVHANLPVFRNGLDALAAGASLLLRLREDLGSQLQEQHLDRLFEEIEMPLVAVLARIERAGILLDVGALAELSKEQGERMEVLVEEIYATAGMEFNIGSPQQLREVLFERLQLPTRGVKRGKTGLSTDVDVLTRLSLDHALPAKILEYRGLAKLKSTYVDALPAAVHPSTGRLHTTFNQTVAATGRLSSSDPNLQNIPIRSADGQRIRSAFIAPPGRKLLVADYSQIELRVLAHLSGDPALVAAFARDEDIHARTAAEVFGVLPGTVTRDMRRTAKVINFGIIYGMGAQALGRELGVTTGQAEHFISSYFERYAGVKAYVRATLDEAKRLGYVTTLFGRRRRMPALQSPDRNAAQAAERAAFNTPIQGSAADLIKLAMVRIDRRLAKEKLNAMLILQVHDELILEVDEAVVDQASELVREEMEGVFALRVPLKVDLGSGANWAAAH